MAPPYRKFKYNGHLTYGFLMQWLHYTKNPYVMASPCKQCLYDYLPHIEILYRMASPYRKFQFNGHIT